MPKATTKAAAALPILPDLTLAGSDGKDHALSSFIGKPLVLYFYPKDNTPGCTTEACDFRDQHQALQKLGVQVVGVSPDNVKSHLGFIAKFELPFLLLADPDRALATALGAFGEKLMYGKTVMGIIRSTFLIDAKGTVVQAWRGVKVDGHVAAVVEAAQQL